MKLLRLTGCLILCLTGSALAEKSPDRDFFPFIKGRYWLYNGTVTYAQDGEVHVKQITGWRSEVLDVVENKELKAALLKGSPGDLAWYSDDRKRGDLIYILTSKGEFYEIHGGKELQGKFAAFKAKGKLPAGLLDSGEMLFKSDMKVADRFGDPEQTKRGSRYCWEVSNIFSGPLEPPVKGFPPEKALTTYSLTFRTNPDHTNLNFTSGLGISFYEYVHHGTKGDCEMHLVKTGDAPAEPAKR